MSLWSGVLCKCYVISFVLLDGYGFEVIGFVVKFLGYLFIVVFLVWIIFEELLLDQEVGEIGCVGIDSFQIDFQIKIVGFVVLCW